MAKYGPAIFHFLANTVGVDPDAEGRVDFKPMDNDTLNKTYGFSGENPAQVLENLKNNIFRIIMLRARNKLIQQMELGDTDPLDPVVVTLSMLITDGTIHPADKPIDQNLADEILGMFLPVYYDEVDGYPDTIINKKIVTPGICGNNTNLIEDELPSSLQAKFRMD